MVVYFDKENFISLFKLLNKSSRGDDILRMLKRQVNIHFNFDVETLAEEEFILFEEFQSGVDADWKFTHIENRVKRPLNEGSFPDKSSIYLIDEEDLRLIKEKRLVLLGGLGEEIDILESLFFDKRDYGFHYQVGIAKNKFSDWNQINPFVYPFTYLILVDRYMFKSNNLPLFDFNIGKILREFYLGKTGMSKLIFVYQVDPFADKSSKYYDEGPDFSELKKRIKTTIKSVSKYCKMPEIFFFGIPNGKILDEHDRHIFSNYVRIKSGDSLIYFDSTGKIISKSSEVDFFSLAYRNYRENSNSIIDKVNGYCQLSFKPYSRFCNLEEGETIDQVFKFS